MSLITTADFDRWQPELASDLSQSLLQDLERGQVLYFPKLSYTITPEQLHLLNDRYLTNKAKNISHVPQTKTFKGLNEQAPDSQQLKNLIADFARQSQQLVNTVLPFYRDALRIGRTSFRPAEIAGRKSSYRKDDTRLHVDAFPSMPVGKERILRVFSNINPAAQDRVWHLGERFNQVMHRFVPTVHPPLVGAHRVMKWLRLTKKQRSNYDHYMLKIHHHMKRDDEYQQQAIQEKMAFPPNTTWMVFTDSVSHAALSGQHLLEQTFYLSVDKLHQPELAPLKQLEAYINQVLV